MTLALPLIDVPTYYGNVTAMSGLFNFTMNSAALKLAYKERCDHSGTLTSISMYCITGAGYSLGTGGSVECRVETDDGSGLPSGNLVSAGANVTLTTPNSSAVRDFIFTTPPTLVAGTVYHFVFSNKDASPAANFISIDNCDVSDLASMPQPTVADADRLALKQTTGPPWTPANDIYYPILRLLYGDGAKKGQSTYELTVPHLIGDVNLIRLRFTPPATKIVSAVHMRVGKQSTTTADLVAKLRNLTGATVLGTQNFPAYSVTGATDEPTLRYGMRHITWTFASPITLTSGTSYAVELSSTEITGKYFSAASRYGGIPASFGANLDTDNRFTEGLAELSTDSGGSWAASGTGQSQYMFFFDVAP